MSASPDHPKGVGRNGTATRAVQKESDTNATVMLVPRADTDWIATASPDHPTNIAPIATVMRVHQSAVTSMIHGRPVRHVHQSIRV